MAGAGGKRKDTIPMSLYLIKQNVLIKENLPIGIGVELERESIPGFN